MVREFFSRNVGLALMATGLIGGCAQSGNSTVEMPIVWNMQEDVSTKYGFAPGGSGLVNAVFGEYLERRENEEAIFYDATRDRAIMNYSTQLDSLTKINVQGPVPSTERVRSNYNVLINSELVYDPNNHDSSLDALVPSPGYIPPIVHKNTSISVTIEDEILHVNSVLEYVTRGSSPPITVSSELIMQWGSSLNVGAGLGPPFGRLTEVIIPNTTIPEIYGALATLVLQDVFLGNEPLR